MKHKITQILAIFVFVSPLLFHFIEGGVEKEEYSRFIFGYYVLLAHVFAFILLAVVNLDGPEDLVKHASYVVYVLTFIICICWLIVLGIYGR